MEEKHQTEELREEQLRREATELEQAGSVGDERESAQHERRADKARYLRKKLEERARSERERR
jgi:hypothetical protein